VRPAGVSTKVVEAGVIPGAGGAVTPPNASADWRVKVVTAVGNVSASEDRWRRAPGTGKVAWVRGGQEEGGKDPTCQRTINFCLGPSISDVVICFMFERSSTRIKTTILRS
jgi:hypothetical protein